MSIETTEGWLGSDRGRRTRRSTLTAWSLVALGAVASASALAGLAPASPSSHAALASAAQAYTIDSSHSSLVFKISHLGITNFYGRFNDLSGGFTLDAENPSASTLTVEVRTASVDTNNDGRDRHLRTADFFNTDVFPTATFKSTGFEKTGEHTYRVTGDFTLNGKTKPITIDLTHTGEGDRGRFGQRSGCETTLVFKRSDYGITHMLPDALGDEVTLIIALEGAAR